jgi:CRP-like cAMP-binding protein
MKPLFLRHIPLFATIPDSELRSLESVFVVRTYRKNQVIYLEEETGNYMYIVLAGRVKVTKSTPAGKENLLAIHQAGDFFGEMALLDGRTSPATVCAMEECRLATISKTDFHNILMRNAKITQQIIQVLCARLRQAWGQMQRLSYGTVEARLRAILLQLASRHGVSDARGIIINLKITHQDLAEMACTARETVTRTLSALQHEGIVSVEQRRIILLDPRALQAGSPSEN